MRDEYNKDYRKREYDKFSDLEPQRERKKPSFLTLLLVGLLVLLVCSLGYDNIIKPYLEKSKEQTEEPMATSTQEVEEPVSSEMDEATAMDEDVTVPEVREGPGRRHREGEPRRRGGPPGLPVGRRRHHRRRREERAVSLRPREHPDPPLRPR